MQAEYKKVTGFISIFYVVLGSIAALLIVWRKSGQFLFDPFALPAGNAWPWLVVSAAIVLLVYAFSIFSLKQWESMRRCAMDIRKALGNLTNREIMLVALASGFGEEMLFRGWLMNETGILLSSLIFGLVHVPINRNWLFWPVFAFTIGLALGWLCIQSQTIIFAIGVHAGINWLNIRHVMTRNQLLG